MFPAPRRGLPLIVAALLALASAPALAIEAFTADYQASYMGLQADGSMSLSPQAGDQWQYTLEIRNNLGVLSQSTRFDVVDGQYRPLSSLDKTLLLVKRKTVETTYDWNQRQATWSGDVKADRAGPAALRNGDMDALLINLAVIRDLAAGKPLKYRMVENGRVSPMSYQVLGKETISVAGKQVSATKLSRTSGRRETVVWVAPDLPAPARILQREDGKDSIDLRIRSWN
ncbi:hypothetical protein CSC70_05830 [Pseudoxanthomonas kalamensis DSM 18571]|uniref:DUF3108 domain-containing protein n=1 Tax=Pseudoxanthomonas kalamensis TaxID=289483 RepID=UPI0013910C73|nr:DUF3108 domain-containing protein [Pseudoxanthomonas kalamensis]KAF1711423.1 hypothetical protein CSC70_05830 [Pseudoxanthomonas kalamensis DSM 18571]